ncbi:MAG TPA: flavin reductase family protein [Tepidiformaceae bacterium]|nr:flavin reductase family protein [Tepidiformaceae bacterium]
MSTVQPFPGQNFPSIPGKPLELEGVAKALLAMSYGVHVIGSHNGEGEMNAMLADWVMQVSFKPRLVAASIENDARTLKNIRATGVFSVNLLHEKDGAEIARKVVMPHDSSKIRGRSGENATALVDKLAALNYVVSEDGCPLLNDALGWYSCRVTQIVPAGDHTVVIGEAYDGELVRSGEMLIERELGWEYGG